MWQIEDLIRAVNFDIEKLLAQYTDLPEADLAEIKTQYEQLISMMEIENKKKFGHLQIFQNIVIELNDLHLSLLQNPTKQKYQQIYALAKPHIELFAEKMNNKTNIEIDICFHAMYTTALLKLQKKEISNDTLQAVKTIGNLLTHLTAEYHKNEKI